VLLGVRHAARLGSDFAAYAVVNRVWWIVPLVLVLLSVAVLIVVGHAAAPLTLYPMF
jgi:hypothetical protein